MNEKSFNISPIIAITVLTLSSLWLVHDYLAFFLSILISSVSFCILLISLIAEYLEKSNLPSWYFKLMIALIAIPLILGLIFSFIFDLKFDWLEA